MVYEDLIHKRLLEIVKNSEPDNGNYQDMEYKLLKEVVFNYEDNHDLDAWLEALDKVTKLVKAERDNIMTQTSEMTPEEVVVDYFLKLGVGLSHYESTEPKDLTSGKISFMVSFTYHDNYIREILDINWQLSIKEQYGVTLSISHTIDQEANLLYLHILV